MKDEPIPVKINEKVFFMLKSPIKIMSVFCEKG